MPKVMVSLDWTGPGVHRVTGSSGRAQAARDFAKKARVETNQVHLRSGDNDLLVIVQASKNDLRRRPQDIVS